jgi:hypothetical protein
LASARVSQFRVDAEHPVDHARQFRHRVALPARQHRVQFFKQLLDLGRPRVAKLTLLRIEDFLLDQAPQHPVVEFHPMLLPARFRIGSVNFLLRACNLVVK